MMITKVKEIKKLTQPFHKYLHLPGSKSITLRNLILASLAQGKSQIDYFGLCDDTIRMEDSLQRLGIQIKTEGNSKWILGQGGKFASGEIHLHLGLSAASTRQLIALSILRNDWTVIDGLPPLRERPNHYLVEAISQLGATVQSTRDGFLPLSIKGSKDYQSSVSMRGNVSSQYFTGLLQIAPLLPKGLTIKVEGELVSKPYIDITLHEMEKFGVHVKHDNYQIFFVSPQKYRPVHLTVEGDASAASYFAAMATLHGGTITLNNLNRSTRQGDFRFLELCEKLGATLTHQKETTTITGPNGRLRSLPNPIDMESMPDVAPTLMAMAPFIPGTTKIIGLQTLRVKECDRIAIPAQHLLKLGVPVQEGPDWIEIGELSPDEFTKDLTITTHHDHRMAMSFAVLGSKVGRLFIQDPTCVNKTYPRFWEDFQRLYE